MIVSIRCHLLNIIFGRWITKTLFKCVQRLDMDTHSQCAHWKVACIFTEKRAGKNYLKFKYNGPSNAQMVENEIERASERQKKHSDSTNNERRQCGNIYGSRLVCVHCAHCICKISSWTANLRATNNITQNNGNLFVKWMHYKYRWIKAGKDVWKIMK